MRVVLISFDALELKLVERYNCKVLKQREYGKIDLEPYFQQRPKGVGGREPQTPHVYSTFETGNIPKDWDEQKRNMNEGSINTVLGLSKNSIQLDVPNRPKSYIDSLIGAPLFSRYFNKEISLERAEHEYFKAAEYQASYASLIDLYGHDLVFFYFRFPDKLCHMYMIKHLDRLQQLMNKIESIAKQIIDVFDDDKTLVIIFSDHGINFRGGHGQYGFWSSNKLLGKGSVIKITDWYRIIEEWYKKKQ